jgi:hypothetical protein
LLSGKAELPSPAGSRKRADCEEKGIFGDKSMKTIWGEDRDKLLQFCQRPNFIKS